VRRFPGAPYRRHRRCCVCASTRSRKALSQDHFILHYQATIGAGTPISHAEASSR